MSDANDINERREWLNEQRMAWVEQGLACTAEELGYIADDPFMDFSFGL